MRVALVHDWLTGMRGGEKVLQQLAALFPKADLYTLIHVPGATSQAIDALRIHASPLSGLPGIRRHYRKLLPLFPWMIERFHLERYDLVISCSHAVAKGVRRPEGSPHLCYCLTPMRYVWDQVEAYLGNGVRRRLAAPLVAYLRRWDRAASSPERVSHFIGISQAVVRRIERHYGREAEVIYPPVDIERIRPTSKPPDDFFLVVGGFVPYKREALAVEAFRALGSTLVIAGDGPTRARIAQTAPSNVHFLGRVSDAKLVELLGSCRALVYPQEEDFGIAAVEAQAAGRPVIAFGRGGAAETVIPLDEARERAPTGIWFREARAEALADAVRCFERSEHDFDSKAIRTHAERFAEPRFRRELLGAVRAVLGH